jgi:hypothetical protein
MASKYRVLFLDNTWHKELSAKMKNRTISYPIDGGIDSLN